MTYISRPLRFLSSASCRLTAIGEPRGAIDIERRSGTGATRRLGAASRYAGSPPTTDLRQENYALAPAARGALAFAARARRQSRPGFEPIGSEPCRR